MYKEHSYAVQNKQNGEKLKINKRKKNPKNYNFVLSFQC